MSGEIDVLRALAHPVRWGILERLAAAPGICACDFTEFFDVSQPTISAHLKALREAGLVTTQRRGTAIWYSLTGDQLGRLADRLGGMAASSEAAPQAPARRIPAAALPPVAVPRAPGRLADMAVAMLPAAAPRSSGRPTGSAAPVPAAVPHSPGRPTGSAAPVPAAVPTMASRLADMAAMAQAAVPRAAVRRSRTAAPAQAAARQTPHRGHTAVPAPAGSAED